MAGLYFTLIKFCALSTLKGMIIIMFIVQILKKYQRIKTLALFTLIMCMCLILLSGCNVSNDANKTENKGDTKMVIKTDSKMNTDNNTNKSTDNNMDKKMQIDFNLQDVKGKETILSDYYGKKIYIKFWSTWCPICLGGLEELQKFSEDKMKADEVIVFTIVSPGSKGEMSADDFKKWFKAQGYKFTVLLDEGGEIADKYGIRAYPSNVLIDSKGQIQKSLPGHIESSQIDKLINEIM